jgi:hypothetical protein
MTSELAHGGFQTAGYLEKTRIDRARHTDLRSGVSRRRFYPSFADSAPRCRAMNRPYTHGTILGLRMAWESSGAVPAVRRGIGKNRGRLIPDWVPIRGGRAEVCPGQTCMAQRQNSNRIDRTSVLRDRSCPSPETAFSGSCCFPNRCYPLDL